MATKAQKEVAAKAAAAAVAKNSELVLLRAIHPIRHNGKDFGEADVLAADADAAAALLESGAAEVAPVEADS